MTEFQVLWALAAAGTAVGLFQAVEPRPIGWLQWVVFLLLIVAFSVLWPATLACEIMAPDKPREGKRA